MNGLFPWRVWPSPEKTSKQFVQFNCPNTLLPMAGLMGHKKKKGNHKSFFVWEERWLEKDFSQLNGTGTLKVTVYPFI